MAVRLLKWAGAAVGYAASFVLLAVCARNRWLLGVSISIVVLAVAAVFFNSLLYAHRRNVQMRDKRWVRIIIPAAMVIGGAAFVSAWWLGDKADGLGFVGISLMFLGIGHLLAELRWSRGPRRYLGPFSVIVPAALAMVGLQAMPGSTGWWPVALVVLALLLWPIGLTLVSGMILHHVDPDQASWRWMTGILVGLALVAGGVGLLVVVGQVDLLPAVVLAFGLTVLITAIASNTPGDVVIVAAVLALLWAITPRGVEPHESALPDDGESVMVALGDSFMSGEGADTFYAGTNRGGVNECRRSPTAYAVVTVSARTEVVPDDLAFVACSGALTGHINRRAQHTGEPINGPVTTTAEGTRPYGLPQLPHLQWLRQDKSVDVKLVIVSIGGNDALFGEIARTCIGPGDCSRIGGRWLENLDQVKNNIDQAYQEIRLAVGDRVPVVVVPYPVPIRETGCGYSRLTKNEHRFLHAFTLQLNSVVARAAGDAGLHYLEDMASALQDRNLSICDGPADEVGVNVIALHSVDGLVEQSLDPRTWFHNSLHPNPTGHQAMAEVLQRWLEEKHNLLPAPEPATELGQPEIATMEQLMGDPNFDHCGRPATTLKHCEKTSGKWLYAQAVEAGRPTVLPLATIAIGGWITALFAITIWRKAARASG